MTGQALTVGEIAKRLRWPIHRVEYLIRSRGIKPTMRVGNLRVFSDDILDRLPNEWSRKTEPCPKSSQADDMT